MRYKDMKQAVKLLETEWDLGEKESGATRRLCAWIYLMEILEETEQFVYYRENGKLMGFSGYSKWNSKKHLLKKKFYSFIKSQLYKSKEIKDLNALKEYDNNYDYVPDNMRNLQILTDESCSFYIYESLGCKKVYETIIENKEYGKLGKITKEKAYIYEKIFD